MIEYSELQLNLLLETVKVLIPLCTGFLVLLTVSCRLLLERGLTLSKTDRGLLISIYVWAVVSLGLWSGVLSFLIDCAAVFGRSGTDTVLLDAARLNHEWRLCGYVAELAHLTFFIAIVFFSVVSYRVFLARRG